MNIWRTVHREMTAAWRSLRYDLGGRARKGPRTEVIPRVNAGAGEEHPEYQAYARRTRRVRAALAVAALSVGGAAATYFGVVGGLTALLAGDSAPPGALPGVAVEPTSAGQPPGGASGRASRPDAHLPSMRPPSATPSGSAEPTESTESSRSRPHRPGPEPIPTTTRKPPVPTPAPEPTPTCGCPRPTPTATASPTPSPSPSPTDPTQPPEPPEWAVAPAS